MRGVADDLPDHTAQVLTVVIPSHDGAATIGSALDSVPAVAGIDVVVVDDGSTDATAATAEGRPGVTVVRQTRAGRCAARNAGARVAAGRYLLFLDDDDELVEAGIVALVERLRTAGFEAPVVRLALDHRDADGSASRVAPSPDVGVGPYIPGSFAVRADAFARVGGYDEALDYSENTELLFRLLHDDRDAVLIDEVAVRHHHRADVARHYRQARVAATGHILERHEERLAERPGMLADLLGIAAHDHFRLGDRRSATSYAWRSLRVRPTAKRLLRLVRVALSPTRLAERGA